MDGFDREGSVKCVIARPDPEITKKSACPLFPLSFSSQGDSAAAHGVGEANAASAATISAKVDRASILVLLPVPVFYHDSSN